MIPGVDVSRWQGRSIDWAKVRKAGNEYVFLKASEGVGYESPTFSQHWAEARQAGLYVGAYHFARVSKSPTISQDARDEADFFMVNSTLSSIFAIQHDAGDEVGARRTLLEIVRRAGTAEASERADDYAFIADRLAEKGL